MLPTYIHTYSEKCNSHIFILMFVLIKMLDPKRHEKKI